MRFLALDVHRDFCEVAIAEGGQVRLAGRVETTPAGLELFAQSLGADRSASETRKYSGSLGESRRGRDQRPPSPRGATLKISGRRRP